LTLVEGFHLRARLAPLQIARDAVRLRRVAREQAVDVLHAHHCHDHWLALLARPRSGGRRPPVARTFHALRAVKRDAVSRRLYRRTDAALAVSRQIEARCREAGVPPERVYWTPGMADLPRFAAEADGRAVREEFALGDAPVVVSVARLAANRGHELLLSGFRGLLADLPAARLLLVGKGETREHLERLVAGQGLARHVTFAGYRDRDLPSVLAAADCFALMAPGSDDSCRAAPEAMAAGRPGESSPVRILHLMSCRGWSSDAYWAARACRELERRGHAVTLGCKRGTDDRVIDRAREEGVTRIETFELAGGLRPALDGADLRRLARALRDADVVHVHRGKEHWLAAAAGYLTGGRRPPVVRTRHIAQAVRPHAANRWLYRRATALVVTVTEAIRRQYLASGLLPPERVVALQGGADVETYRPGPADPSVRRRLGGDGEPLVGLVSGLRVMKGHQVVV